MIVVHDLEHLAQADDATSTTAGEGSLDLGVCVVQLGTVSVVTPEAVCVAVIDDSTCSHTMVIISTTTIVQQG